MPRIALVALFLIACKPSAPKPDEAPPATTAGGDADTASGDKAPGFPDDVMAIDGCDVTASRVFRDLPAALVRCPTDCTGQAVYGSDVYDLSSSLCAALLHAGAIAPDRPLAYVERVPAPRANPGSEANGITSRSQRGREHVILARAVGADGSFAAPRREPPDQDGGRLTCSDGLGSVRMEPGETVTLTCPENCLSGGGLWGSNPYTADSVICRAAIHAGAIGPGGGTVRVRRGSGAEGYEASEAHGTTSWAYRATGSSLEIVVD
ncbi:MAG: LCCL domain-containing protein [Myxococcota bacterium]